MCELVPEKPVIRLASYQTRNFWSKPSIYLFPKRPFVVILPLGPLCLQACRQIPSIAKQEVAAEQMRPHECQQMSLDRMWCILDGDVWIKGKDIEICSTVYIVSHEACSVLAASQDDDVLRCRRI